MKFIIDSQSTKHKIVFTEVIQRNCELNHQSVNRYDRYKCPIGFTKCTGSSSNHGIESSTVSSQPKRIVSIIPGKSRDEVVIRDVYVGCTCDESDNKLRKLYPCPQCTLRRTRTDFDRYDGSTDQSGEHSKSVSLPNFKTDLGYDRTSHRNKTSTLRADV